jgi:hypothetical protein
MTRNLLDFVRGTTRPILTYALVGTMIYCIVTGTTMPGEVQTITGMTVAFWFGSRTAKADASPKPEGAE